MNKQSLISVSICAGLSASLSFLIGLPTFASFFLGISLAWRLRIVVRKYGTPIIKLKFWDIEIYPVFPEISRVYPGIPCSPKYPGVYPKLLCAKCKLHRSVNSFRFLSLSLWFVLGPGELREAPARFLQWGRGSGPEGGAPAFVQATSDRPRTHTAEKWSRSGLKANQINGGTLGKRWSSTEILGLTSEGPTTKKGVWRRIEATMQM